jgi:DNA topoisomerase-1
VRGQGVGVTANGLPPHAPSPLKELLSMGKSLIIVESPAKTRTLKSFLGDSYDVRASMGHVRDLPKSRLGVDIENRFQPHYVTIRERKDVIRELKSAAQKADQVYLASDPDREGEAIAWHLSEELKLSHPLRIEFNEITKQAVENALRSPRELDSRRIEAQQARRVLDRLVGYKLSPLLWRKVKSRLSAGRVQSVAVRLVCDREREIQAFQPVEYWTVTATLTPLDEEKSFDARLVERDGKKLEIPNEETAKQILADLEGAQYAVSEVKQRQQRRNPAPPFITSTLQQEAARKLGFSAKRTMMVAQQLYEGLDVGGEGTVGLITYMRTDSTRTAQEAIVEVRGYIGNAYGSEYVPEQPRQFRSGRGAQEAHEAIRPTSVARTPDSVRKHLTADQARLYTLIWQRFVASQMAQAVLDVTTVDIAAGRYTFRASGSVIRFPGFMKVYQEGRDDQAEEDESKQVLPELTVGELLRLIALTPKQRFTEPPPRYSEATLVKALEERGIGRPSTYASIISTIQERGYVVLEEKRFKPTELGFAVTDLLVKHFPDVMDVEFTAAIESKLDDIEEGEQDWVQILSDFYQPFSQKLDEAAAQAEKVKIEPIVTDEVCPNCGKPMLLRRGRFGPFLGCSGFPECRTVMPAPEQRLDVPCPRPNCTGEIVQKRSRKGRIFYGCSRYPECDFVTWHKPTQARCETCGYPIGERTWRGRTVGTECTNKDCPTVAAKATARQTASEGEPAAEPTASNSKGKRKRAA